MSANKEPDFFKNARNVSNDEICKQFYKWFADQGGLADAQANLRTLLIRSLRGTTIGAKPSTRKVSPKCQAFILLIADFLYKQKYYYSLSVLSSEIPPQPFVGTHFSNYSLGQESTYGDELPQLQRQDVWCILENLGLSPVTEAGNKVFHMLQDKPQEETILIHILEILINLLPKELKKEENHNKINDYKIKLSQLPSKDIVDSVTGTESKYYNQDLTIEDVNMEINKIINESNLKNDHKVHLEKIIQQFLNLEVIRIKNEMEQKHETEIIEREKNIQSHLVQRDNLFKRCLSHSEEKIVKEKQEVWKGKQEISKLAIELRESHENMERRFQELDERQEIVRARELEIERLARQETARFAEQASELDIQKRKLDQELQRLQDEQDEVQYLRHGIFELRRNLDVANHALSESQSQLAIVSDLQHQCNYLKRELNSSKHYLKKLSSTKCFMKQQTKNLVHREQQTEKFVESSNETSSREGLGEMEQTRLEQENAELRARCHQQELRIVELTNRAMHLTMNIEEVQSGHRQGQLINDRHSSRPSEPGTSRSPLEVSEEVAPPPPPPPLPSRIVTPVPSFLGAGEELHWHGAPAQAETPQQHHRPFDTREMRRKPPRRLVIHNQSSSDESSPTDEILQEARMRLRTLEEESAQVDRRFRDFKLRQANFLDTATSVLHPDVQFIPPQTHKCTLPLHLRRNHIPSLYVPQGGYGGGPSGVRLGKEMDAMTNRSAVTNLSTNSNTTPTTSRMTELFCSSTSSDEEHYIFPHQTSDLKLSSIIKQMRTTVGYKHSQNDNAQLSSEYCSVHPNSLTDILPQHQSKRVHFIQNPQMAYESFHTTPHRVPASGSPVRKEPREVCVESNVHSHTENGQVSGENNKTITKDRESPELIPTLPVRASHYSKKQNVSIQNKAIKTTNIDETQVPQMNIQKNKQSEVNTVPKNKTLSFNIETKNPTHENPDGRICTMSPCTPTDNGNFESDVFIDTLRRTDLTSTTVQQRTALHGKKKTSNVILKSVNPATITLVGRDLSITSRSNSDMDESGSNSSSVRSRDKHSTNSQPGDSQEKTEQVSNVKSGPDKSNKPSSAQDNKHFGNRITVWSREPKQESSRDRSKQQSSENQLFTQTTKRLSHLSNVQTVRSEKDSSSQSSQDEIIQHLKQKLVTMQKTKQTKHTEPKKQPTIRPHIRARESEQASSDSHSDQGENRPRLDALLLTTQDTERLNNHSLNKTQEPEQESSVLHLSQEKRIQHLNKTQYTKLNIQSGNYTDTQAHETERVSRGSSEEENKLNLNVKLLPTQKVKQLSNQPLTQTQEPEQESSDFHSSLEGKKHLSEKLSPQKVTQSTNHPVQMETGLPGLYSSLVGNRRFGEKLPTLKVIQLTNHPHIHILHTEKELSSSYFSPDESGQCSEKPPTLQKTIQSTNHPRVHTRESGNESSDSQTSRKTSPHFIKKQPTAQDVRQEVNNLVHILTQELEQPPDLLPSIPQGDGRRWNTGQSVHPPGSDQRNVALFNDLQDTKDLNDTQSSEALSVPEEKNKGDNGDDDFWV